MSKFDCKIFHDKCHAMCCKCVPIEKEIYDRNQHNLVQKPEKIIEFVGTDSLEDKQVSLVLPITEDGYCPFLGEDLLCNIQDDKPSVCKKYGSEKLPCLRCPYQDKDGRKRSRQESRKILRDAEKSAKSLISNSK
jgi:hypothetical protein